MPPSGNGMYASRRHRYRWTLEPLYGSFILGGVAAAAAVLYVVAGLLEAGPSFMGVWLVFASLAVISLAAIALAAQRKRRK